MTQPTHLVEQHILEYQSRMKHVDELLDKAKALASSRPVPELVEQLDLIHAERNRLAGLKTESMVGLSATHSEQPVAGPMAVWDVVANQLEKLIERFEHKN